MSHTIIIDESNGNGLYAIKNNTSNTKNVLTTSVSNEDLSQSLSEYTDADESMSAPTEFLAEFLSAVMLKDYKKAFKYCKLILQYEPNNTTAKDFYPLIQEKLLCDSSSESDENYNKSSSPEIIEIEGKVETTGSEHSSNGGSDSEDAVSSDDYDENNLDASNSNTSTSRSDNTTHSYSSLLLEDDDEVPQIQIVKELSSPNLDLNNGNYKSPSCSDSESPTEPLTQRIVAILRSKCVPAKPVQT